jgi:hypothetical protein
MVPRGQQPYTQWICRHMETVDVTVQAAEITGVRCSHFGTPIQNHAAVA